MSSQTAIPVSKRIVFTLIAVVLTWLCLEQVILLGLWLRPWKGEPDYPFLYGPHPYRAYAPVPHRVSQRRVWSFNSFGFRGAEIAREKPTDTIRIVCLGGSTTFGDGATTDSTTYPARLERLLRERYRNAPFRIEVINAGVQAYNSFESLIQFQTLVLDFSPDIAVFHHGINDCWFMLDFPGFQSDFGHARRTFTVPPRRWWEYSPFLSWCFARDRLRNPYFPARHVNLNTVIVTRPEIPVTPPIDTRGKLSPEMIATFERNTRTSIYIARAHGIIPVLSTQSAPDDSQAGRSWFQGVERLNQVTRDLAARESLGMIDIAQLMPWNPVDYFDGSHLRDTRGGLGRKAEIFAQGLLNMRAIEQAWERRQRNTHRQDGG